MSNDQTKSQTDFIAGIAALFAGAFIVFWLIDPYGLFTQPKPRVRVTSANVPRLAIGAGNFAATVRVLNEGDTPAEDCSLQSSDSGGQLVRLFSDVQEFGLAAQQSKDIVVMIPPVNQVQNKIAVRVKCRNYISEEYQTEFNLAPESQ